MPGPLGLRLCKAVVEVLHRARAHGSDAGLIKGVASESVVERGQGHLTVDRVLGNWMYVLAGAGVLIESDF